jgi:branched-chain amino acid transport system permease protein
VLNGAIIGAMYGIIALGITLTFGITGIVNFALGEFMMIGAYATYALAERGGLPYPVAVVPACLIAAAAGYLSYFGLARTWLGRAAFAYAQNPEAAMLMGVHTPRMETAVMLYSTGLAGLGGALYASLYSLEPAMGGVYVLKGMEAAILGGIGSLMGSLWGGVILGVIEAVGSIFLPTAFRDAYGLAVLVAILLFRPSGLFGDE